MLMYHVMTGVIPFQDNADWVQVRHLISAGTRPNFSHRTYQMMPQFDYLQDVLESCWQNSPQSRPSASELLEVMRNPSFLCLKQTMKTSGDEDSDAILYANSSIEGQVCIPWIFSLSMLMLQHVQRSCLWNTANYVKNHCTMRRLACTHCDIFSTPIPKLVYLLVIFWK